MLIGEILCRSEATGELLAEISIFLDCDLIRSSNASTVVIFVSTTFFAGSIGVRQS